VSGLPTPDVDRILEAARALLADPGVMLEDDEVVARMLAAGARPGSRPRVVRMEPAMIDDWIGRAPGRFTIADRRGARFATGPATPSRFWTGAALFYADRHGVRPIARRDLADFARVVDRLANTDAIVGTAIDDVPPPYRDFAGLRLMAANTRKHLRALSFTPRGGEAMLEMGRVLAGSAGLRANPVISLGFTAHGPLRWTGLALGVFKATAGHGVPVTVNGEPMAGASAPVTLAGTAAVGTAEILSGIIVNQLLEPGRPCFFNLGFSHVMDMRSGFAVTGGPENCLLAAAGADIARRLGLPSASWMCTDSLAADAQNAAEKTLAALTHVQAGVSVVWGIGQLESEKTISPIQAAIDDEIVGAVRRYAAGFPVDDAGLAIDEIRRVGIAGSFLASDHTLEHFRGAIFEPRLMARLPRVAGGPGRAAQPGLAENAEAFVDGVLAGPREPTLSEAVARELEAIERRYAGS
jgi:trimethylamine---corrinoid protein Co-methyltransferase